MTDPVTTDQKGFLFIDDTNRAILELLALFHGSKMDKIGKTKTHLLMWTAKITPTLRETVDFPGVTLCSPNNLSTVVLYACKFLSKHFHINFTPHG